MYVLIYSAYADYCGILGQTPGLPRAFEALTKSLILDAFGTSIMEVGGTRVTLC